MGELSRLLRGPVSSSVDSYLPKGRSVEPFHQESVELSAYRLFQEQDAYCYPEASRESCQVGCLASDVSLEPVGCPLSVGCPG